MITATRVTKRGFVDTPDGQIHYRVGGSGEALLLLHQSPRSSDEYADMIPILAQKKRVIAMDTMGFGDSDIPARPYSVEDYAQTVIMLLNHLGVERTSIAAHHTGSKIAIEVAASHPERVDKLVLSGCYYHNEQAKQWLLSLPQWVVKDDGSHLTEMFQWGMAQCGNARIAHRRVVDLLKAGETSEYGHKATAGYYLPDRLPLIQSPTLLIYGEIGLQRMDARGWEASKGRHKVEKAISRCRSVVVPGGATYFPSEMPEEFSALILEFLKNPSV